MTSTLTDYQAKYYAHELQRSYANDHVGKLAGLLFDAQVEPKPHQIDREYLSQRQRQGLTVSPKSVTAVRTLEEE